MSISNIMHPNGDHIFSGQYTTSGDFNFTKATGVNINSVPVFTIDETGASHVVEADYTVDSLLVESTTDATTATDANASVHVKGGVACEKSIYAGTLINTPKLDTKMIVFNNSLTYNTATGDINVTGVSLVYLGSVVAQIDGFIGGVQNQIVHLVKTSSSNNVILKHNGSANQDILLAIERDQNLVKYASMSLVYTGSVWFTL